MKTPAPVATPIILAEGAREIARFSLRSIAEETALLLTENRPNRILVVTDETRPNLLPSVIMGGHYLTFPGMKS